MAAECEVTDTPDESPSVQEVLRRALLHAYGEHQDCSDRSCWHRETEWDDAARVADGLLASLTDHGFTVVRT